LETANGEYLGEVNAETTLIGRSGVCDIVFPEDLSCSRHQAQIDCVDGKCVLIPLSENTPVYLNGRELLDRGELDEGASIAFGAQSIVFRTMYREVQPGSSDPHVPSTAGKDQVVIGRDVENVDLHLDHPTVSRRHAVFHGGDSPAIQDLGSTNGTYCNGRLVSGKHRLSFNDRVEIGPYLMRFDGEYLHLFEDREHAGILASGLCVDVEQGSGGSVRILDNASVSIGVGEFVCIVGPSGSGKSTLMKVLSGRSRSSLGTVRIDNMDLALNFESLKHQISFVPQHDLLHEDLTLARGLSYTARLRLPKDTTTENIRHLIESSAEVVGLSERMDTRIADLSGGQKKRASLASETLSKPNYVFLDEVTSGLDEVTDREIMSTLHTSARSGTTIVCVTHTMANVEEFCDRVVVMAEGGVVAFDGPPSRALDFFGVGALGQIYDCLKARSVEYWRDRQSANHGVFSDPPTLVEPKVSGIGLAKLGRGFRQYGILTSRNLEIALADRRGLAMAAVQSVVIGFVVGHAFSDFGTGYEVPNSRASLFLLLALCSIWLGCNYASQQIVGEFKIFQQEHDVNLSGIAFVLSKFTVGCAYACAQFAVVYLLVHLLGDVVPGPIHLHLFVLFSGVISGVSMGLILSSVAETNEQANLLVPLTLVPQLVFSGIIVPNLPEVSADLSQYIIGAYWLIEALRDIVIHASGSVQALDAETGKVVEVEAEALSKAVVVVLLQAAVMLILAVGFTLRRVSR